MEQPHSPGYQPHTSASPGLLLGLLLVALILGALVPLIYDASFVPAAHWQKTALYISLALLACAGWWLRQLQRDRDMTPEGLLPESSPLKRLLLWPVTGLFLGSVLWINLAVTLPMVWTGFKGQEAQELATVQAEYTSTRGCRYQFAVEDINFIFFEFCIDEEDYLGLPDTPMPAQLLMLQSHFGKKIYSLNLGVDADEAVEADEAWAAEDATSAAEAEDAVATTEATAAVAGADEAEAEQAVGYAWAESVPDDTWAEAMETSEWTLENAVQKAWAALSRFFDTGTDAAEAEAMEAAAEAVYAIDAAADAAVEATVDAADAADAAAEAADAAAAAVEAAADAASAQ